MLSGGEHGHAKLSLIRFLQEYCLNRDPRFFRNTKFVCDRFHWPNHSAYDCFIASSLIARSRARCSSAYRMDNYEDLHGLNSSIAEQYHSYLRRLREMAKHMRLDHFMTLLRVFVNLWNADKISQP